MHDITIADALIRLKKQFTLTRTNSSIDIVLYLGLVVI